MPTPVDLIDFAPTVRAFLDELSQNNNRDWFRRQKGRYDAEVKRRVTEQWGAYGIPLED